MINSIQPFVRGQYSTNEEETSLQYFSNSESFASENESNGSSVLHKQ